MSVKTKQAIQFGGYMMLTAVVAFLLQPLLLEELFSGGTWEYFWKGLTEPLVYLGLIIYLFVYFVVAVIIWPKCKAKSWPELALIYALVVNIVILLSCFILKDLLALFAVISTIADAWLSLIPIGLCCYLFKRKMDKTT